MTKTKKKISKNINDKSLTDKQLRFCNAIIQNDGSKTAAQCALDAGYGGKQVRKTAYKLLQMPKIKQIIGDKIKSVVRAEPISIDDAPKMIADAQEVLETITRLMRDDKVLPRDKLRACELLCKRYSLLTENVNNNVSIDTPIVLMDIDDLNELTDCDE